MLQLLVRIHTHEVRPEHYLRALLALLPQRELDILSLRVAGRYFAPRTPALLRDLPATVKVEDCEFIGAWGQRGYILAHLGNGPVLYGYSMEQVVCHGPDAPADRLGLIRRVAVLWRLVECAELLGCTLRSLDADMVAADLGLVRVEVGDDAWIRGPDEMRTTLRTLGGRAGAILREEKIGG
jgi:hypothetical protein